MAEDSRAEPSTEIAGRPPLTVGLLGNGRVIHIRPIQPEDVAAHESFTRGLSAETQYFRFFGPKPRLTPAEIDHFCNVDHVDREALVALVGDEIIGVVRYERIAPATAEIAFAVADAWQGHGVGTLLLEHLAEAARDRGILTFTAEVLATNHRMIGVFQESGFAVTTHFEPGGTIHVELGLQETTALHEAMTARHRSAERARDQTAPDPD
jgi:GNAT superfamily N-acetyltransferase